MDERAPRVNGNGHHRNGPGALARQGQRELDLARERELDRAREREFDRARTAGDPAREADLLHDDIRRIRGNLGQLIDELDARRRHAMDVRMQVRRHPVVTAAVAVALLGVVGGAIALGVSRRRRRRTPAARLHGLRLALARMAEKPDSVAKPEPTVGRKIAASGGSAAAGVLAKHLAQRLVGHGE